MSFNRTHNINIRVTPEELNIIKTRAQQANMTVSRFMLYAAFKQPITIYEVDQCELIKVLTGLQRHYNTIRYRMQQSGTNSPIISDEFEQEIRKLWQLSAQAREPNHHSEV